MFIRYVGSGYKGSKKGFNMSTAVIALIIFLVVLVTTSWVIPHVKRVLNEDGVYKTVCKLYGQVVSASYNMHTYDKNDQGNGAESLYGNLYGYAEAVAEHSDDMVYSKHDPGYQLAQIKLDNRAEEESVATEAADSDHNNEVVVDDGGSKVEQQGIEGYVVPAVATNGITYSMEQLSDFDFLMSKLYTVPSRALVYESDLVAEKLLAKDMTMQGDNSSPQVLIYHTHSQEGFVDSVAGDDSTSIVAVGTYLAKILAEEYGYNVIHCTEHFDVAGGTLDRSKAYTYAQASLEQILEDNPTIEVVLDIHRDGLPEGADKLLANINGKDVAKIMFFNGISRSSASGDIDYLYNRYQSDNLAFSMQLKLKAMECYPEFTRRNYIDAYQYNLHHRPKSVLVEVGAQNNTLQEALNSMEVLAEVLHRVLNKQ